MNSLTILLTTLTGLFSAVGLVPERVIEQNIRSQLNDAETLLVRADTRTDLQLLQGEIEQLRIAGRGIYPFADVRIDTVDIETDTIDINIGDLRRGQITLDQPLQGGINVVLTQSDINQALRSPLVIEQLESMSLNLLGSSVGQLDQSTLIQPQIRLLADNRLQITAALIQNETQEALELNLTTGVEVRKGTQIHLIEPKLLANNVEFPNTLVEPFLAGLSEQYTLKVLEDQGITARILQLQITDDHLRLATFVHVAPRLQSSEKE